MVDLHVHDYIGCLSLVWNVIGHYTSIPNCVIQMHINYVMLCIELLLYVQEIASYLKNVWREIPHFLVEIFLHSLLEHLQSPALGLYPRPSITFTANDGLLTASTCNNYGLHQIQRAFNLAIRGYQGFGII